MRHLEENGPLLSDLTYYNWLDVEGVVHRWLLDSISPSVKGEFLALDSAKNVWEAVLDSHSKKHNIATLYELVHRASNLRQGDRLVLDYINELTALWAEIDHYMPPDPTSVDRQYTLQLRVFKFLMGLNPEYEQLRGQLIHRETLSFKDALRSVRLEESRLQQAHPVTLQPVAPASAMALQPASTRGIGPTGTLPRVATPRVDETPRGDPSLTCNYCKKKGHTKETCYKLQRKRTQQAHVATLPSPCALDGAPTAGQVPMPYGLISPPTPASLNFTPEEMERLRRLLDPPVVGSCSLAHAGTSSTLTPPLPPTSPSWIVDSGASIHMTPNPRVFTSYEPSPGTSKVRTASGDLLTVAGVGRVALTPSLHLPRVYHVPRLAVHLLSLSKLVRDLDHNLTFSPNTCFYRDKVSGRMTTLAEEHQGLYLLRPPSSVFVVAAAAVSSLTQHDRLWLLRRRLGHPSFSTLKLLFPSLFCGYSVDRFVCDACRRAKHHWTSYPPSTSRTSSPFSLIHTDVWGPAPVHSTSGARWLAIFVDDTTRFTWAYLLKHKSELSTVIPHFYTLIQTQFSSPIRRFCSDNAKDYVNSTLTTFFNTHGIIHETSCPYTPQQNGLAERKFRHVLETSRTLLFHMHVPKYLWGEAALTAIHLLNRLPSRVIKQSSPIDCLQRFFPHVPLRTNLVPRVFGCVCFAPNPPLHRDKLDPRALRCIFVGYSSTQKGYWCYYPPSRRFFITKDATFDESLPYYSPSLPSPSTPLSSSDPLEFLILPSPTSVPPASASPSAPPCDPLPPTSLSPLETSNPSPPPVLSPAPPASTSPPAPPCDPLLPTSLSPLETSEPSPAHVPLNRFNVVFRRGDWHASQQRKKAVAFPLSTDPSLDPLPPSEPLPPPPAILSPSPSTSSPPATSSSSPFPLANYVSSPFLTSIDSIPIPKTVDAALASSPWRCAMEEELRALDQNHTWDLVPLPAGKHLVGSRWVYAIKENSVGSLERHKARVVAKGFTQKYGLDYQETFAPVAKMNTVRILLALAAHHGWKLQQYDVKNAFLHGNLTEEIYMALPPGYYSLAPSTPASVVCRLWKSLYGLKQSPRAWFARFTTAMLTRGYRQCNGDHTLFFHYSTSGGVVILLVYVDDIIITGDDESAIGELALYLGSEFAIKHLGPLRYFLGIEVAYSSNGLFICQRKYTIDLL